MVQRYDYFANLTNFLTIYFINQQIVDTFRDWVYRFLLHPTAFYGNLPHFTD